MGIKIMENERREIRKMKQNNVWHEMIFFK